MATQSFSQRQYRGDVLGSIKGTVTATIPSTATGVNSFVGSISVPGARAGDFVSVSPAAVQTAGVSFGAQVTANDTIAITCSNGSAGTYNPGSQTFNVFIERAKLA